MNYNGLSLLLEQQYEIISDVLGRNCYNVDMLYIPWRNRRFRGFGPSYINIARQYDDAR